MIMRLTRGSALPWLCPAPMAEIYWSCPGVIDGEYLSPYQESERPA
jgi:hypothetical protein